MTPDEHVKRWVECAPRPTREQVTRLVHLLNEAAADNRADPAPLFRGGAA